MTLRNTLFTLLILTLRPAFAPPLEESDYVLYEGGAAEIPGGSIVEGSAHKGGIQPDYVIDLDSDGMKTFLSGARKLKKGSPGKRELIDRVVKYVDDAIKGDSYTSEKYRALLKQYKERGENVPLSEYLACNSAVCRENGLLLHFALKEVGIENKHVYAFVAQGETREDHAFVVVDYGKKKMVFDAYNSNFNGTDLEKLMEKGVRRSGLNIKVERINNFPRIWVPKELAPLISSSRRTFAQQCGVLFHDFLD